MEIRTSDARTFIRLTHLVTALDRSRFTDEQLEIVDAAIEAIERVEASITYNNERKKKYITEKRAETDSYYGQSYAKKATKGGKIGRPRKTESTQ